MKNNKMKDVLENIARRSVSDDVNVLSKVSVQLKRKSLMMTLRTRPLLMVLVILLSLLFLSSVVYAIGKVTGYIPGVGLIDQSMPLRVLAEPVSITRDEVTVTVTSALLSADKTVIFLQVENVPSDAYPNNESDSGCRGKVDLRLPDGNILEGGYIHGGNWNTFEQKLDYPPVPFDVNEGIVLIECIGGTIPNKLPVNWEIPIRFFPALPEMTVMPIVDIQPTFESDTQLSTSTTLYDILLHLDQFIPLDDGYYLIGHTKWTNGNVLNVTPSGWLLKAYDSLGNEIPIDPAIYGDDLIRESLQPHQWVYKIYGKNFNGPITLRTTQQIVEFVDPIFTTIDLPISQLNFSDEYFGNIWKLNIPINIPEISAQITNATYIQKGDMHGFDIEIQADSNLRQISFGFESGLVTEGLSGLAGGGGGYYDEATGKIYSSVLTNAPIESSVVLSTMMIEINGLWETIWNPPSGSDSGETVFAEQSCLNLSGWKEVANKQQTLLPTELNGKILTMRGALFPEPSLFISNVDGSEEQGLVFGHGSLSPDGTKVVYSDENNILRILDMLNGNISTLNISIGQVINAYWSPDGKQIAFDSFARGNHIFVMDANGENLRQLTSGSERSFALGWSGDGKQILFISQRPHGENMLKLINVDTNSITDLWSVHGDRAAISPDNQWIAFVDKVNGKMGNGIYISRLDGTDKRLIVQLDYWVTISPAWSPQGNWLGFSVLNTDLPTGNISLGAININSCEAVFLGELNGYIRSWIVE
jgi:hypothetical protein